MSLVFAPSILGFALLGFAQDASAQVVVQASSYADLAAAIAAAGPGGTVEIDAAALPVAGAVAVHVPYALTVQGIGHPVLTGGDPSVALFDVHPGAGARVSFVDVGFDGDHAVRPIVVRDGQVALTDVTSVEASAGNSGGVVLAEADAESLTLTRCAFGYGSAGANGGLIAVEGGALTVADSTLDHGTAGAEGGLVWFGGGAMEIADSRLSYGTSGAAGGGVRAGGTDLTVLRSVFAHNVANGGRGGGGMYIEGPVIDVTDSRFEDNEAHGTEGGGGVYHRNVSATFTRDLFCRNSATNDGGGARVHDAEASFVNSVFLANAADRGGALFHHRGEVSVSHGAVVLSAANSGAAGLMSEVDTFTVIDTYLADHEGLPALSGGAVSYDAFWRNAAGDFVGAADDGYNVIGRDSLIATPDPALCEPTQLIPPAGSPLIGAGTDGSVIGPFDGPGAWVDTDDDGYTTWDDCDDDEVTAHPGGVEQVGTGIDEDCDGVSLCFVDADGDGVGEDGTSVASVGDLACDDPGEASVDGDLCVGFDDRLDDDQDGAPNDCDVCPDDPLDDSDFDGVCDSEDACLGFDDAVDTDGDGTPNGCDVCATQVDSDDDGQPDDCDVCPGHPDDVDADGDARPDGCDPCPDDPDPSCVPPTVDRSSPDEVGIAIGDAIGCGCAASPTGRGPGIAAVAALVWLGARRHRSPRRRARG